MSTILMTVPDGGGTVPPDLSVASALRRRGHQVRVLSDPVLRPEVEAAGAEHVPWTRAPHRLDRSLESEIIRDWEARTPMGGFAQMRDRIACGPAADYAGDVVAELRRRPADAVVTDFVLPGAMIAAEAAGLPLVILGTTIYPFPVPGVPPMGPGFMPAHGALGRARDGVLAALTRKMWDRGLPAINAARADLGLAPVTAVTDVYDRADRFLVLTSESFEFPSSGRPANVRYVGPRLDDPAWTDSWVPPAGDQPLVLVALSSTHQGQVAMLSRVAEAFNGLGVRGLITTGPSVAPAEIDAPPNVTVVPSAPHRQVLEHADLVVTHTGHGTTIKSLSRGVPLVCLPMGRDQNDVAARVVAAGAGVRLRPGSKPPKVAKAIQEVLGDPAYASAARQMAESIASDVDPDRAVAEIEALLPRSAEVPAPA
jgi:MGT family glycosyltransferase